MVKASGSRAANLGSITACAVDVFGSSHTSDLKTGTPVATLPGARSYRISAGNDRHSISILLLD